MSEARPSPRDADELHDALLGLVVAPADEAWDAWLGELVTAGRAGRVDAGGVVLAFSAENAAAVSVLYPGAPRPMGVRSAALVPPRDEAVLAVVRGHAETCGPFTASRMAARLRLEGWEVDAAVARLEADGVVLRGRFTPGTSNDEVCDRRLLARIHRLTLDRLRSAIEPVSARDLVRYALGRHHLTSGARAGGRAALREAIEMLQGFEIAAAAWEPDVLAPRVQGYRPEWLDELCLAGEVVWARLSPRRATSAAAGMTSRATPITLAMRRDLPWLIAAVRAGDGSPSPMPAAATAALAALQRRGALFLDDLAAATRLDRDALTGALWDLVGRGFVIGGRLPAAARPDGRRPRVAPARAQRAGPVVARGRAPRPGRRGGCARRG